MAMTINKNDVLELLRNLGEQGEDVDDKITEVLMNANLPIEILAFINSKRPLDLTQFYEKLRTSYNAKKSKLYISILKDEISQKDILITLSSYQLQATLYANKVENSQMFARHSRLGTVNTVLANYYKTNDITPCYNLLRLIRADLMACEIINGRRGNVSAEDEKTEEKSSIT